MAYKQSTIYILFICATITVFSLFIAKKYTRSFQHVQDTLIIGTNAEYPPFSFIENGTIVGLDIDIIKEIARRLHKKIVINDMPFDALMPHVQLGTIQVIAAGMTPSPERAQQVFFTPSYVTNDPLIMLSLKNNPVTTLDQLRTKQIVVNEGYTADYYISSLNAPHITRLATVGEALLALQSGRADVFVTAQSAIQSFMATQKSDTCIISVLPGPQEEYAFIVSKKHPDLHTHITNVINDMKKDGTIAALRKKWHL